MTMKVLTKIILVQWYLFEAQEIPIIGHTGILGANGAGKSSIIDAVQVVLSGGDKNKIALNKGSNAKSSRSIREYCLGVVSDPNSIARVEPRERSNTYLTLCFKDTETGDHFCAGVAISSTATNPKETIEGYFITRGRTLTVEDFTDISGEDISSLEWGRVRDRFLQRFNLEKDLNNKASGIMLPNKGPGDFSRHFYTAMSADQGLPMNPHTITKALLSSIAFKPIADTTMFVRKNMLDPQNVNIRELRDSLNFWRGLRDKAKQTAEDIAELKRLEKHCEHVEKAKRDILQHRHTSLAAQIEMCYEISGPAEEALYDLQDVINGNEATLQGNKKEASETQELLFEKKEDLKRQDSEQKIQLLEGKNETLEEKLEIIKADLNSSRAEGLKLEQLQNHKKYIPDTLNQKLNKLQDSIGFNNDLLKGDWLKYPEKIDRLTEDIVKETLAALPGMDKIVTRLWGWITPANEEFEERSQVIASLENNETPLDKDTTLGLADLLKKNRIDSTPICDLVDVNDEEWRGTIEAVLGKSREALIVSPENATTAIRIYRYEGKKFRGSQVVNTRKTAQWKNLCKPGSLAEKITTENPHARAFINLRLGNILCVESEADLLKHDRAATSDLMLNSGGTTTMKTRPRFSLLGIANRKKELQSLKKEHKQQEESLRLLKERQQAHSKVIRTFEYFSEHFKDKPQFFTIKSKEDRALTKKLKHNLTEIASLKAQEDSGLKELIDKLDKKYQKLSSLVEQQQKELDGKRIEVGKLRGKIEEQNNHAEALTLGLREMEKLHPEIDRAEAAVLLDKFRMKFQNEHSPHTAMVKHIADFLEKKAERQEKDEEAVRSGLQEFMSTHSSHQLAKDESGIELTDFDTRAKFISEKKIYLEETTLADYEDRSSTALAQVESLFRNKFISRIGEHLKRVRDSISDLNKALKGRPFHGEYYQFRAHAAPELKAVYRFAEAFDSHNPTATSEIGSLFSPENDPDSPHKVAVEQIKKAFQDDEMAKTIQDYRNYFIFDVEMFDLDGNKVANLKHRIAKGSGGENMAPFYVAIGSSLTSAYKIVERPYSDPFGGMNLAPFDEAFSLLDPANTGNCLDFLKDVNLQVLLAAPEDKYTFLASRLNTIVWITKDGSDVDVEIEHISNKTHTWLKSDSPFASKKEKSASPSESHQASPVLVEG
jgi:hypothetical protein